MGDINFSIDTGLVEALKRALPLPLFIETGTFEGDAIAQTRGYFTEIHSIELSPEYYNHAKRRFAQDSKVHLYLGDSARKITELAPIFRNQSVLFWLDAHWCVAQSTGGEKSQCPLLQEIRGIGALNENSAIMIDDARLFASPPPQPHEISQWPRLDEVIDALRSVGRDHELKIFNDVIVFAPRRANPALTEYMTRNTVTLLKIKDKADGYDVLDAQLKEKHAENDGLKVAAVEKDGEIAALKRAADKKDEEIGALKRETDHKDREIADLKQAADAIKAELEAECAEKDGEIAELKTEADGKDREIASLKQVSNEREQLIFTLDGHVKEFQKIVAALQASHADKDAGLAALDRQLAESKAQTETLSRQADEQRARLEFLEPRLAALPPDATQWGEALHLKDVHIRNIEAVVAALQSELAQLRRALADREAAVGNLVSGLGHHEIAKFYLRQIVEKESVMQELKRACDEREALIQRLVLENTGFGSRFGKLWTGVREHVRLKYVQPASNWLFRRVVEKHWMQVGVLRQYEPRPIVWDRFPKPKLPVHRLPKIGIVTPSFNQRAFVESTMLSVLNQNYPKLRYVVQDGDSTDGSQEVIARHAARLQRWESVQDAGQADAIRRGFNHITDLGPDDVMAWLNSDDFITPRSLHYVGDYFARHPEVDVIYGNRIVIDEQDRDIGRWTLPPHDPRTLEWIDYVPQETMFWRKRIWDRAGGIDQTFQFALDWDLLMRFAAARARIVRLPYFLGCFRVHAHQKTSQHIHSIGNDEMTIIRNRIHPRGIDPRKIEHYARKARFWGAVCSRLAELKVRI